jgi:hypothetical protein
MGKHVMPLVTRLDTAIRAVASIDGVSIGNPADKLTWQVQFSPTANAPQKTAAQAVIDGYIDVPDDISSEIDVVQFKIMLNHENRIRVLEGKTAITMLQFQAALKVLLGG